MSEPEDSKPATDRSTYGKGSNRVSAQWSHLSKEKREQYEAIEKRVREKVERGEL